MRKSPVSASIVGPFLLFFCPCFSVSAADDSVYRQANFDRADSDMAVCPAAPLSKTMADHHFIVGRTDGNVSVTAATGSAGEKTIWAIIARSTGPESSEVTLRNNGATADELQLVWKTIEECEKLRF